MKKKRIITMLSILIVLGTISTSSIAASLTYPIGCQSEKPGALFTLAPGSMFYIYPGTHYQIKVSPSCFVAILQEDSSGGITMLSPSNDEWYTVKDPPRLRKIYFWVSTKEDEFQKISSQINEIQRISEFYKHQLRVMLEQETLKEMIQSKSSTLGFKRPPLQE